MAKTATKTNVPAKRASSELATGELPDWMKGDAGKGTENIDRSDLEIARLKLIQGTSPELETYSGLRAGMYFHSATEAMFDPQKKPLRVVPIYIDKRYLLWNPIDSGGGILARADDGMHWSPANREFTVKLNKADGGGTVKWKTAATVQQSGLADWGSMNPNDPDSAPAATFMINYMLGFPDFPDMLPAVLTFQRTSISAGRKWNTKLKTRRAPIFGQVFELGALSKSKGTQNWKIPTVTGVGLLEDANLYRTYKEMNESLSSDGLKIKDIEGLQDEDPNTGEDEPEEVAPKGKNRRF